MPIRFGFVSTYPPTLCGLATFTAALSTELMAAEGGACQVIRVVESRQPRPGPEVVGELVAGEPGGAARAARQLSFSDVAIVQHEYGAYGGPDGDEILPLLAALTIPSVVVLHTVLSSPTPNQRAVLEQVTRLADAVVTMTPTARDRLASYFRVDMSKVTVIPHGAPTILDHVPSQRSARPTVLTWGLIGPGKGIEWAIAAMAELRDLEPAPLYIVAGQTHPKVLARDGERYRNGLATLVADLRLADRVTLDGRYRDAPALAQLVDSADIVLLPYDSTDQVTSGVLIEAVAALKPVIATRFPHAVELLGQGAGLLVPQRDPAAIAAGLRSLLTHHELTAAMSAHSVQAAPDLLWPNVARRYRELAQALIKARIAA